MNNTCKSFTVSGLLHMSLLCSFLSMGSMIPAAKMAKVINFSLVETLGVSQPPAVQAPPALKPVKKEAAPPRVERISVPEPVVPLPTETPPILAETPPEPVVPENEVAETGPVPDDDPIVAAAPTPTLEKPGQDEGSPVAEEINPGLIKELYVRANFQNIQSNIQNSISYPRMARKMGWEGKVVVKFTVDKDGSVENAHIVESSGFAALDKNAISTIKKAAPFPSCPARAELVVPVIYRLA